MNYVAGPGAHISGLGQGIEREKDLAGSDVVCLLESAANLAKDAAE